MGLSSEGDRTVVFGREICLKFQMITLGQTGVPSRWYIRGMNRSDPTLLGDEFFARPAERVARYLAWSLLLDAARAAKRLEYEVDGEALHDFRVRIRKLRTFGRALKPLLGSGWPKGASGALKEIATATNAPRDREVEIERLTRERAHLGAVAARGATALGGWLGAGLAEAYAAVERTALPEFYALERDFRRRLSGAEGASDGTSSFASELRNRLLEHERELDERAKGVAAEEPYEAVHRVRIALKRLRYLLEPAQAAVGKRLVAVTAALAKLKELQEQLGGLNDLSVLTEEVSRLAATELPGVPHAEIAALATELGARRDALYAELGREALAEGLRALKKSLGAAARELRSLEPVVKRAGAAKGPVKPAAKLDVATQPVALAPEPRARAAGRRT